MNDLDEFLKRKQENIQSKGFDVSIDSLNHWLKPFQKFCVRIALHKGRFAFFEDCGLGKTLQALEWSRHISKHTGKPVLNIAPLAVVGQTIKEGKKFGIEANEYGSGNIQVINYEQIENVDFSLFGGIVGDEISIIKNYEGHIRNKLIELTREIDFKLGCSATPSPNDPMELGNTCEWLGVMSRNEMLAMYFTHDGGETSKWRIKGHAVDNFWKFVNTWALMFSKPSEIDFDDEGYILPKLNFIEKLIITPQREGCQIFNEVAVSASNFHREVRLTKFDRLDEVVEIVNNSDESFIVWVEQNAEGDYLEKMIHDAIQVSGSDTDKFKKDKLLGFSENEFRVLVTKPKIASFGMNYQNCHNMIFASPDFSFEKMYQAIRRELRYGQSHTVNVYAMVTDTMQNVMQVFKRKQKQQELMQRQFIKHTKDLYEQYREAA